MRKKEEKVEEKKSLRDENESNGGKASHTLIGRIAHCSSAKAPMHQGVLDAAFALQSHVLREQLRVQQHKHKGKKKKKVSPPGCSWASAVWLSSLL
jgi:hypothetical protein